VLFLAKFIKIEFLMKELIIHIGFGKTGSSALQSWLAQNQSHLSARGYHYAGVNKDAREFLISSGNAAMLLMYLKGDAISDNELSQHYFNNHSTAIISGEQLQALRSDSDEAKRLERFCEKNCVSIKFVAYIRNFHDHFYSNYVQAVKRHGYLDSFAAWVCDRLELKTVEAYFSLANKWEISLIKYELAKENLAMAFCSCLDIDYATLMPMSQRIVNRSISSIEIQELQKLVRCTAHLGYDRAKTSRLISDYLVNSTPNMDVSFEANLFVVAAIRDRHQETIHEFNTICKEKFGFAVDISTQRSISTAPRFDFFQVISTRSRLIGTMLSHPRYIGPSMLSLIIDKLAVQDQTYKYIYVIYRMLISAKRGFSKVWINSEK
jgi:hypothetical protein